MVSHRAQMRILDLGANETFKVRTQQAAIQRRTFRTSIAVVAYDKRKSPNLRSMVNACINAIKDGLYSFRPTREGGCIGHHQRGAERITVWSQSGSLIQKINDLSLTLILSRVNAQVYSERNFHRIVQEQSAIWKAFLLSHFPILQLISSFAPSSAMLVYFVRGHFKYRHFKSVGIISSYQLFKLTSQL